MSLRDQLNLLNVFDWHQLFSIQIDLYSYSHWMEMQIFAIYSCLMQPSALKT